ncbi:hypothetical protein ACJ41O_010521 [Fusarium nematophilum]
MSTSSVEGHGHRCHHCNITYERRDHLVRHLKAHENKRPHRCSTCGKGFNRAFVAIRPLSTLETSPIADLDAHRDLLHRHGVAHAQPSGSTPLRRRTSQACDPCVKAKTRCDEERPCKRCKSRGWDCNVPNRQMLLTSETENPPPANGITRHSTASSPIPRTGEHRPHDGNIRAARDGTPLPDNVEDTQMVDGSIRVGSITHLPAAFEDGEAVAMSTSGTSHDSGAIETPPMPGRDMLHLVDLPDSLTHPMMIPGLDDTLDFDAGMLGGMPFMLQGHGLGVLEGDLGFLADGLTLSSWAPDQQASPQDGGSVKSSTSSSSEILLRSEAFRESVFSWIPEPKESAFSDQGSIDVREDAACVGRLLISQAKPRHERVKLDEKIRYEMLRLVSKLANRNLIVSSFPSSQLLEDLVNLFLSVDSEAIDSFIQPGLCGTKVLRTELLLAMVAGGAGFIALEPVWKMGLVLQEVVRIALIERLEEDNSLSRHPQTWKIMLLWLEIGTFSGFRRKTEIALSFLQPLVTMMTWAHVFQPGGYETIIPKEDDSDEVLQGKWRSWVEQENVKRVLVQTFLFDSQVAICHTRNPLLSPAQMQFPAPAAHELWLAQSPRAWRDAHLRLNQGSPQSSVLMVDIFRDSGLLGELNPSVDRALCTLAACHRLGHDVWQHRQQRRLRASSRGLDELPALKAVQRDLYEDLATLQSLQELSGESIPSIAITIELLSMLLHVDLEDVQVYCGKLSAEEARKVTPRMAAWVANAESRVAAWHAGQVFRAARSFDRAKLRGFYVMAIYQAALTLWTYGMAFRSLALTHENAEDSSSWLSSERLARPSPSVFLDGADERLAMPFKRLGYGTPGIRNVEGDFVPLSNLPGLMSTAASLLRSNYPQE